MSKTLVVSDASGTTAERVLGAALTQFEDPEVEIVRYGQVRTPEQISEIVAEAADAGGFIIHTLVSAELRNLMLTLGRAADVPTIDLMGPLLARLSEILASSPRAEPGLFNPFDETYNQRIEAINFTVRHDDGRRTEDLSEAEIVLTGVSRTCKTPLSIYLSYRGWKVANVPLVLDQEPPPELMRLPRNRVVGLIANPERLAALRQVRARRMGHHRGYADLEYVRKEMEWAFELFGKRRDWPLVDVTVKPIEESAAEVVSLLKPEARTTWKPGVS
jgi:regulator of PEP synthase PpsR (kinase-PPPase family)